jgi:hypothetical protein
VEFLFLISPYVGNFTSAVVSVKTYPVSLPAVEKRHYYVL